LLPIGFAESFDLFDAPEHDSAQDEETAIAEAVRDYVRRHPESMDSVEGIAHWWIPDNIRRPTLGVLRRVLDRLVAEGVLNRVLQSEHAHYRASRH
jgi:hypothetical protein